MRTTVTLATGLSAVLVGVAASLVLPAAPAVPAAVARVIPTANPLPTGTARAELASSDPAATRAIAGSACTSVAPGTLRTSDNLTLVCASGPNGRRWRIVEG